MDPGYDVEPRPVGHSTHRGASVVVLVAAIVLAVALLGGHTVRDDEIKFGYAITGVIDPKNIKQNKGARVGDLVFLTKPLGTGLISTALKKGRAHDDHVHGATVAATRQRTDRWAYRSVGAF
jgi:selenophosphate synthase